MYGQGVGAEDVLELSENEEERKKAIKKGSSRPSRQRGAPRLWRNLRERAIWRADLAASDTVRVYLCVILCPFDGPRTDGSLRTR